jgi:hypothetical protein
MKKFLSGNKVCTACGKKFTIWDVLEKSILNMDRDYSVCCKNCGTKNLWIYKWKFIFFIIEIVVVYPFFSYVIDFLRWIIRFFPYSFFSDGYVFFGKAIAITIFLLCSFICIFIILQIVRCSLRYFFADQISFEISEKSCGIKG